MSKTSIQLKHPSIQCDQIGRFIALWATFQSLLQQLFCPNRVTFLDNFCNGVKIFYFSSEIIFGQLLDIWLLITGHTASIQLLTEKQLRTMGA